MSKPWEYMSRDEKLDYIKERLDSIDASLSALVRSSGGAAVQNVPPAPDKSI